MGDFVTQADLSMRGRVCLITGATDGIGKFAALDLATKGATVVIVGRNPDKCEAVKAEIEELTGSQSIDYLVGDLSSFKDVRNIALEFLDRYNKLHVLINNAGGLFMRRKNSVDGIEMTWALNHFGYFWLTCQLIDVLKASSPSRIINVSSDAHRRANLFDMPNMKEEIPVGYVGYANTKLANLLFTYHLAYAIKSTGVTVNTLHPGVVATNFGADNGLMGKIIHLYSGVFGVKPDVGARTIIHLASAPEVYAVTGKYFVKEQEANSSRLSYDTRLSTKLWSWSIDVSRRFGLDTRRIEFLR